MAPPYTSGRNTKTSFRIPVIRRVRAKTLACLFLSTVLLSAMARVPSLNAYTFTPDQMQFAAVYRPLAAAKDTGFPFNHIAISDDGQTVFFAGWSRERKQAGLFRGDVETGAYKAIALSGMEGAGIQRLITNKDGSKAFFMATRPGSAGLLYCFDGSQVRQILQAEKTNPRLSHIEQIQCTEDGNTVFFLDRAGYSGDVWRVGYEGNGLAKVIEDTDIIRSDMHGGKAYRITEFAVSGNGRQIAFLLNGEFDPGNAHVLHKKNEVYLKDDSGIRRLTDDDPPVDKYRINISGNGRVIVYHSARPEDKYWALRTDGQDRVSLGHAGFNFSGLALSHDGQIACFADADANGGRLVFTDGSAKHDLFPVPKAVPIRLTAVTGTHLDLSGSGKRIVFACNDKLYVGHLNEPGFSIPSPDIQAISVAPLAPTRHEPRLSQKISAKVSHTNGMSDLVYVTADDLLEGVVEKKWDQRPVEIRKAPLDKGQWPDDTADDGIFTTFSRTAGHPDPLPGMGVRVAALDKAGVVVVKDVRLDDEAAFSEDQTTGSTPPLAAETYTLSQAQQAVVDLWGHPDAFTIAAADGDPEAPETLYRMETWYYFKDKLALVYLNGEYKGKKELADAPAAVTPAAYRPAQFVTGMPWRQFKAKVLGIGADEGFTIPAGSNEYEPAAHGSLLLGFEKGVLVYADTTPEMPGDEEDDTE